MAREFDWHEPGGVLAHPHLLAPALTILAQFDAEYAVLDQEDIARLTSWSGLAAERCLVTLAELGYLEEAPDKAYRLADGESGQAGGGHDEDGTLDTAA